MDLRLEPELAAKVEQWSAQTGRPAADLVEAAIVGYFNEVEEIKCTLDSRFDELESGVVKGIPGEEALRILEERIAARQRSVA
jgi:predicted DNA-binding protein